MINYFDIDFTRIRTESSIIGVLELDTKDEFSLSINSQYQRLGYLDEIDASILKLLVSYRYITENGKNKVLYKNYKYYEITSSSKKGDRKGLLKDSYELDNPAASLKSKMYNYGVNTDKVLYIIKYS